MIHFDALRFDLAPGESPGAAPAKAKPTDYIADTFIASTRHWQGRQQELTQLQTWLADPDVQLVGLLGVGGFGKSALAQR